MNGIVSADSLLAQAPLAATAQAPAQTANRAAARKAAEQFEAVFLTQMLNPMFEGVGNGPFSGGEAEGMYRSLLLNQYGEQMAKAGGVGIADQVMNQILKVQEI